MGVLKFEMSRKIKLLIQFVFIASLALNLKMAAAQEVQKIVAIVNDDIISGYDVIQRINMNIFMSGVANTRETRQQMVPSVIKTLIDDQLKLQEAKLRNTEATGSEINSAIERFERRYRIKPGSFEPALKSRKVDPEAVIHQIRAGIAWDKIIRRRIVPRINVTEEEVKSAQEKMRANKGKNEYLTREIFLPVSNSKEEQEARKLLQSLYEQLKKGGSFARIAVQFSKGPTAARGGAVNWQMAEEMLPEIANAIINTKKGAFTNPVRTSDGYYIVSVSDVRQILSEKKSDSLMELSQIVLAANIANKTGKSDSLVNLANATTKFVDNCSYLPELFDQFPNAQTGKMGNVRLSNLPDKFRNLVANLKSGQASTPLLDKDVYRIFVVCNRKDNDTQADSEETIRQQIGNKRIAARARRYLNDLRREANIESR